MKIEHPDEVVYLSIFLTSKCLYYPTVGVRVYAGLGGMNIAGIP